MDDPGLPKITDVCARQRPVRIISSTNRCTATNWRASPETSSFEGMMSVTPALLEDIVHPALDLEEDRRVGLSS